MRACFPPTRRDLLSKIQISHGLPGSDYSNKIDSKIRRNVHKIALLRDRARPENISQHTWPPRRELKDDGKPKVR